MPSVSYDHSLYRTGFRPTGTDPFAATQMSGIFSPQHLHGMGNFFSPEGGSALHGLAGIVPNQAVVSYQGTWPLGGKAASDLLTQVSAALLQDGLNVRGMSSDAGILANSPHLPTVVHQLTFNVKLQIQVANGMGYADPNDIISIIRHEVYTATGQFPITDSIPTVQLPSASGDGTATTEATGQPDTATAMDWGTWLQNNFALIAATAVGVVLLPKILGR